MRSALLLLTRAPATSRRFWAAATVSFLLATLMVAPATLAAVRSGNSGRGAGSNVAFPGTAGNAPQTTTTVFLVRHAERAAAGDPELEDAAATDPPLSAAGRERAEVLARTLAEAGVTAVYASEFARTRQTVEPLAAILGLEVTTHPAADTAGLVELLRTRHPGDNVVIAGHSNTVPAIIEALGAGVVAPIEDAWEFDNLYVVVVEAPGRARVSTLKYGAVSSR